MQTRNGKNLEKWGEERKLSKEWEIKRRTNLEVDNQRKRFADPSIKQNGSTIVINPQRERKFPQT